MLLLGRLESTLIPIFTPPARQLTCPEVTFSHHKSGVPVASHLCPFPLIILLLTTVPASKAASLCRNKADKHWQKKPIKLPGPLGSSLLVLPTSSSSSAFLLCTLQSHSLTFVVLTCKYHENDTSGRTFQPCSQWVETWALSLPREESDDGCSITLDLKHKGWVRAASSLCLRAKLTLSRQIQSFPFSLPHLERSASVYVLAPTEIKLVWHVHYCR